MTAPTETLRPHRRLITQGVVAVLALTMPVFAVIYWLTAPSGGWQIVLLIQLLVILASVLAVFAFFGATIQISSGSVRERGFFGRVSQISSEQVGAILLIDLYQSSTLETQPQLFVTDPSGKLLMRMRGQFWPIESMRKVADSLEVTPTVQAGSVTLSDLRRTSPELLYWFERFPRLGR